MSAEMVEAALGYADNGWRVFPLHEIVNGRCSCQTKCGSPGKHPRVGDWDEVATTDPGQVREWWTRWPTANIGVATGPQSDLWVLDLDAKQSVVVDGAVKPEGEHSLRRLELQHGELPPVPAVETPSGGMHLFFKYPKEEGQHHGNRSGLRPSVDVRGWHGYVVAAPSTGISGRRYRWLTEEQLPAVPPPDWLVNLADENGKKPWDPHVERIREGEGRHEWMFKYAASRRGVHGDDQDEILAALMVKNKKVCDPPLFLGELEHIAESVVRRYEKNQAPPEFGFEIPEHLKPGGHQEPPPLPEGMDLAISLFDLLADPPPAPDPLVYGMLLQGQGAIIASRPNAGKSWVAMALALAVASGRPFLGRTTVQKPVLYVDEEGGLWSDSERMRLLVAGNGMGTAADVPLWLAVKRRIKIDTEEGVIAVARMMERYRPGLIVFDSLVRLHRGDENSSREVAGFFERADKLMEMYGCTVLFLHHTRKRGQQDSEEDPFDWMRGSGDLQGWPQSTWVLKTTEDRLAPELWNTKQRDMPVEHPFGIRIRIDATSAAVERGEPVVKDRNSASGRQETILGAIDAIEAGGEQATADLIADVAQIGRSTASRILNDLVGAGRLVDYQSTRRSGNGSRPQAYRRPSGE